MKKLLLTTMFALAAAFAATAATDDVKITFQTDGPDSYMDGTRVKDGEFYALIWVAAGHEFAGLNADPENLLKDSVYNKVIATRPNAVTKYLGEDWYGLYPCSLQISKSNAESLVGGTFYIVMLDTRNADGTVDARDASGNRPLKAVNGYKEVSSSTYQQAKAATLGVKSSIVVSTVSDIPATCPQPEFTDIKKLLDGGYKLKVNKTKEYLRYKVVELELKSRTKTDISSVAAFNGRANELEEVELTIPATAETNGFFQIVRQPLNKQ